VAIGAETQSMMRRAEGERAMKAAMWIAADRCICYPAFDEVQ
jgi:hypothetical protein